MEGQDVYQPAAFVRYNKGDGVIGVIGKVIRDVQPAIKYGILLHDGKLIEKVKGK